MTLKKFTSPLFKGLFIGLLLCCVFNSVLAGENKISRGPFVKQVVLGGQLSAANAEKIYTPRTDSWRIQIKWLIEEGSTVEPGEVVVRFDNSGMLDKLESLEKEIESTIQDIVSKKSESENSQKDLALQVRTEEINVEKARIQANIPKDLRSEREHQEKQLALVKAEKALDTTRESMAVKKKNFEDEVRVLEITLHSKRQEYARQQEIVKSLEVRARTGGAVIYESYGWEERKVQEGDTMQATWPVVSLPDLNSLEVEAFVSENDLAFLKVGQEAELILDAYPDTTYSGTVTDVSRKGETKAQWGEASWFRVGIKLDKVDLERMRPGMSIRTAIKVMDIPDALLVPLSLVAIDGDGYSVHTAGGEKVVIEALGSNAFHFAVDPNGGLRDGMELRQ